MTSPAAPGAPRGAGRHAWLEGHRPISEALFPAREALPFGPDEARVAAELFRELPRPRGRETDLAIAACALVWKAKLWTLNVDDFADVPGLGLRVP